MNEMVSFCGLLCNECGAFIATKNNDNKKRKEVAELWRKEFKVDIKLEEVNCTGCLSNTEPLFKHCKVCQVRKCASERDVENCAYCDEYACETLEKIFQMAPETKKRLDKIRIKL